MFRGRDRDKKYSEAHMLAEMTALLGPPPLDFLQRSEKSFEFWDESGKFCYFDLALLSISLSISIPFFPH
jgi:hypothetical protein